MNTRQRAELSSRAHSLKPIVRIGKDGVTAEAITSIQEALSRRDLLKIKVLEGAPGEARDIGYAIAEKIDDAEVVRTLGRVVILYRPIPKE